MRILSAFLYSLALFASANTMASAADLDDPMVVEAFMRRRFDIMDVFHSYRDDVAVEKDTQ